MGQALYQAPGETKMSKALPWRSSQVPMESRYQTHHFMTYDKCSHSWCSRCGETPENHLVLGRRKIVIKNLPRSLELCLPPYIEKACWTLTWCVWANYHLVHLSTQIRLISTGLCLFGLCYPNFYLNSVSLPCVINITMSTIYSEPQLNRYMFL